MNNPPQIQGYQFDQRLLEHPLAELWHGRSFTGMEVVALLLTAAGAADPQVRERLAQSSRSAALAPGQHETPLWAANFNSDLPYAITQLIPGQSGAERLLDPLDGLLGNDEQSLSAVRSQLSQYGAAPPPAVQGERTAVQDQSPVVHAVQDTAARTAEPRAAQPVGKIELAREYRRKLGSWVYAVVVLVVLIVFTVTYSIGAAVGSAVKDQPVTEPVTAPVKPEALPSSVLLPGIAKIATAAYIRPDSGPGLVGDTYPRSADVQVMAQLDLPFAFGWPRPPATKNLGDSSTTLYRQVRTAAPAVNPDQKPTLLAQIAVRQCQDLAKCLASRAAFDKDWTSTFKVPAPQTAKAGRTWFTVSNADPYTLVMTRAYSNAGRWWLVGVAVSSVPEEQQSAQWVFNDIWRQTN